MGLHNRFPIAQWIIDRLHEDNFDGFEMHYKTKQPDGLLHPSTHLAGCEVEMCHDLDPEIAMKPKTTAQLQTFLTGTLWHAWLQGQWESGEWDGIEARCEQKMGEGLPKGWQGSCDLLLGQFGDGKLSEAEWTIIDYKTVKGSGVGFIDLDKPKPEQLLQVSAYYHAAEAMGYKMNPECCVVHIPKDAQQWKEILPPIEQWMAPLPRNVVFGEMKRRSKVVKDYLAGAAQPKPMEPVEKHRVKKGQTILSQEPDWRVKYCNSPQCACVFEPTVVAYDVPDEEKEAEGML